MTMGEKRYFYHEQYFKAYRVSAVLRTRHRNLASLYVKDRRRDMCVRKYNKVFSINNVQLSALAVSNIISFPGDLSRAEHSVFLHVQKNLILWNAPKKYYVQ